MCSKIARSRHPIVTLAAGCLPLAVFGLAPCAKSASPVAESTPPAKSAATEDTKMAQASSVSNTPLSTAESPPPADSPKSPATDDAQGMPEPPAAVEAVKPERLILLTPRGPLIVHLHITIGDEPQAAAAIRVLEQAYKLAVGDARDVTWEALVKNPRFASGLLGNRPLPDDQARERAAKQFDLNGNQRVDRDELAAFLSQGAAEGHPFAVASLRRGVSEDNLSSVTALVDEDGDGRFSASERAAAGTRLLGRDADDDEVLVPADFLSSPNSPAATRRSDDDAPPRAIELQPRAMDTIYFAMWDAYVTGRRLDADGLALVPSLLTELDANGSRDVDQRELSGLVEARPDLVLKIGFPPLGSRSEATVQLEKMSDDLARVARADSAPGRVTLNLSDYHLELFVVGSAPDRTELATAVLTGLDTDENQSLDADEAAGLVAAGWTFETIDQNQDGKLSLDEIKKSAEALTIYRDAQVQIRAGEAADPLFGWLDADNDGRLTRRELDRADARLAELDADGDDYTAAEELPGRLSCAIVLGTAMPDAAQPTAAAARDAAGGDAPRWMKAMDVNSDGEISRREFLGTSEQFTRLDANADTFIDAAEAKAAGGGPESADPPIEPAPNPGP
jgi:Ca2+-binding EF-hand superfamily protein